MYDVTVDILQYDRVHKYVVAQDGRPLSRADAWGLWQRDEAFRSFFIALLVDSPFAAYRWETPPVTTATVNDSFEFVLLNSPGLAARPDTTSFAEHFSSDDAEQGIVIFDNLGGDALLVVSSPRGPVSTYTELAAFVRGAPVSQIHALWRAVGRIMQEHVSARPLWLSTAGGGVAWLHIRLDSRPKYYGHAPYTIR